MIILGGNLSLFGGKLVTFGVHCHSRLASYDIKSTKKSWHGQNPPAPAPLPGNTRINFVFGVFIFVFAFCWGRHWSVCCSYWQYCQPNILMVWGDSHLMVFRLFSNCPHCWGRHWQRGDGWKAALVTWSDWVATLLVSRSQQRQQHATWQLLGTPLKFFPKNLDSGCYSALSQIWIYH